MLIVKFILRWCVNAVSRSKPPAWQLYSSAPKGASDMEKPFRSLLGQYLLSVWIWSTEPLVFLPFMSRSLPIYYQHWYVYMYKSFFGEFSHVWVLDEFILGGLESCLIDGSPVLVIVLFVFYFEGFFTLLNW